MNIVDQLAEYMNAHPGYRRLREILSVGTPTIIEVGACDGWHTRMLAGFNKNARIISFEADPRNVELARRGMPHGATLVHAAIGDVTGRVALHLATPEPNGMIGASSLSEFTPALTAAWPWLREQGVVEVDGWRLDDYVYALERVFIGGIDLLWMDVQGAERRVFAGARDLLARGKIRYIWTEHDGGYADSVANLGELATLLPGWRLVLEQGADALFAAPGEP
jgi:FkbM family methyltransferase